MVVTLKDIARRVDKSVTTVSRALHGYDDVSPETTELVRSIAAEMGYSPNTLAQRLQKQSADTIGLILPTFGPRFSDPFFSELLAGIGNQASHLGYDLLVSTRSPGEQEMSSYRDMVDSRRVDGFILVRIRREDERVNYLRSTSFPFVAFGRVENRLDFPYVDEDGEYGMGLVVDHLVGLGYRRIACIVPDLNLMFAHYRLRGLKKRLATYSISLNSDCIRTGDLTQRSGYEAASSLLELPEPPEAIVACNDLMALGAISAAQDHGMEVGRDVAVTGFDDIPMAEHFHPPLTTVNQPIYQIGRRTCEMLVKIIRGEEPEEQQILLKPSLVVRSSCGA